MITKSDDESPSSSELSPLGGVNFDVLPTVGNCVETNVILCITHHVHGLELIDLIEVRLTVFVSIESTVKKWSRYLALNVRMVLMSPG
jgi:hypothetical protein